MVFLYLHGFNSDGGGWKAAALQRHFPQAQILAPDLPAEPQAVIHQLDQLLNPLPEQLYVVGTSLGGFYAYYLSAMHGVPAWLFNPSLQPYETLRGRGIGHFKTWTKGRDYHFQEAYLAQLVDLKKEADQQADHSHLRFFLATDDEVLDHSALPAAYPTASFTWIENAGHRFSKFEKILKQARQEAW